MMKALRRALRLPVILIAVAISGCGWHGPNSVALPGTAGRGPGHFSIQAQLPDVVNMQQNSRVQVGDVIVGNVTKIERQGWHALITMAIDGNVNLPANCMAVVGQTSLLGSLHIELTPPKGVAPEGRLHNGVVIPLSRGSVYPTTEQTLAALSLLLNGGGIGQIQDITQAFSTAFAGREDDLRDLIKQLDTATRHINDQTGDIIHAGESLDNLVGQFAAQQQVLDRALNTVPAALRVLSDDREKLTEVLDKLGKLSALAADSVNKTKRALVTELNDVGPVLQSLADAGPALTRSLSFLATYPWPKETITNWVRGDYANETAVFDFTLSRLDQNFLTGTRWEGNLTELELQWGRTIGQTPSPQTAGNPLIVPYHLNQGP